MSLPGLEAALDALARGGKTVGYGALAQQLVVPGPGSIAKLTASLEAMMAEDVMAGRPLRAALCHARGSDLPAKGFFDVARALGRFDGTEAAAFVTAERAALFKAAGLR